jgi:superfamily I DNA/RNA helicase
MKTTTRNTGIANFGKVVRCFHAGKDNAFLLYIILVRLPWLLKTNPTNNILKKKIDFFIEEISWIKGKLLLDKEDYLNAKRTGRGTTDRVTKSDREFIWQIFVGYSNDMKRDGKLDYDDYAIYCLQEIEKDTIFIPPYSHIIVDEAQDLSKAQILTISKIISTTTKCISIIADIAQRIYKSGFSWTEVGIEVRGNRTLSLKKNYRNTEAISLAATSLLSHDPDPSEFTKAEPARKGGIKPILGFFSNWTEESNYIIKQLKNIDYKNELTILLHRDWYGMRKIHELLSINNHYCPVKSRSSYFLFINN